MLWSLPWPLTARPHHRHIPLLLNGITGISGDLARTRKPPELGECQAGQCSCPTNEYEKVEAMDVESSADAIAIRLRAKPGTEFDTREIETCLHYTVTKVSR